MAFLRNNVPAAGGPRAVPARARPRGGFTLLELLVVLAVIGVLAGLILSAAAVARQEARRVQCMSNLRQCVMAAQAYAADHGGQYPPAQARAGGTLCAWDFKTTVAWGAGGKSVQVAPGLLWEGYGDGAVLQCPAYTGKANWMNDPYSGFNYNTSYIGHGEGEPCPAPAYAAAVKDPAHCALFGDGEYEGGADKFMRAPCGDLEHGGDSPAYSGRSAGTQGFRHRGRTNVAFCDGHVESLAAPYKPGGRGEVSPGCGFLSPDNSLYDLE